MTIRQMRPYTMALPDRNDEDTWDERTPPLFDFVTGIFIDDINGIVMEINSEFEMVTTALAGSSSIVAQVAELNSLVQKATPRGGVIFGKDDTVVLGSGEAGATISENVAMNYEYTYIGADRGAKVITNLQNGWDEGKVFEFTSSGQIRVDGNTVFHAGNFTPSDYLPRGAKAADADKVDGLHAASFLRSDTNDTASGIITFTNIVNCARANSPEKLRINYGGSAQHDPYIGFYQAAQRIGYLQAGANYVRLRKDGGAYLELQDDGKAKIGSKLISVVDANINSVGSLVLARRTASGVRQAGAIVSGSELTPTTAHGELDSDAPTLSGTWKLRGRDNGAGTAASSRVSLWERVA